MATADALISRDGPVAAPMDYTVPSGSVIIPDCITASFDGTAAAGTFQPELQLISQDGRIIARCPTAVIVAAGASADVTWFPGLGGVEPIVTTVATLATVALITSGQTIPNNAYTTIPFDTVLSAHDPDGVFSVNLSTGVVTTTQTGVFSIVTFVGFTATASGNIRLLLNGTAGAFGKSEDSFAANSDLSCAGALNSQAAQTFQSLVYQDSGSGQVIQHCRTTIAMLAPTP